MGFSNEQKMAKEKKDLKKRQEINAIKYPLVETYEDEIHGIKVVVKRYKAQEAKSQEYIHISPEKHFSRSKGE